MKEWAEVEEGRGAEEAGQKSGAKGSKIKNARKILKKTKMRLTKI